MVSKSPTSPIEPLRPLSCPCVFATMEPGSKLRCTSNSGKEPQVLYPKGFCWLHLKRSTAVNPKGGAQGIRSMWHQASIAFERVNSKPIESLGFTGGDPPIRGTWGQSILGSVGQAIARSQARPPVTSPRSLRSGAPKLRTSPALSDAFQAREQLLGGRRNKPSCLWHMGQTRRPLQEP